MKLSRVAGLFGQTLSGTDVEIRELSVDTRTLQPNDIFVAIQGERIDGHTLLHEAQQKGACAALVQEMQEDCSLPQIFVANAKQAITTIATDYRSRFSIPCVALTGSCGKTTTKQMLASILSYVGDVLATPGNRNNEIGVPLTMMQLRPTHRFAVFELGARHVGDIAHVVKLVKPDIAFITNVAPVHIETFGDLNAIFRGKSEIYDGLSDNGVALINVDDAFANEWLKQNAKRKVIRFGMHHDADVSGELIAETDGRAQFKLCYRDQTITVDLPFMGQHNVMNALAAASAAIALDISLDTIKTGLENATNVNGRMTLKTGLHGSRLIDDSYNANPSAVESAINTLAGFNGVKIFVFGDMAELGSDAQNLHRRVGEFAKAKAIQHFYSVGTLSRHACEGFGGTARHFDSQQELADFLKPLLTPDTTCLIKGSRSSAMENIVNALVQKNS